MGQYKTALQNLEAARRLIRPFKRWTTGHLAINEEGFGCGVKTKHAQAFCALGAVKRANGPGEKKATNLLRIAALQMSLKEGSADLTDKPSNNFIFEINDDNDSKKNHTRVLKLFARAIKLAKA